MELSRISFRGWLGITAFLVGFIVFLMYLNWLYASNQSYKGVVIEKYVHWVPRVGFIWMGVNSAYFIRVETQDGKYVRAQVDVGMYSRISVGDHVIKKKGDCCPYRITFRSDPKGKSSERVIPRVSEYELPFPNRNPELSRELEEYGKTR